MHCFDRALGSLVLSGGMMIAASPLLAAPQTPPSPSPSPTPTETQEAPKVEGDTTRMTTTITVTARPGPMKTELGPDVRTLPANSSIIDPSAFEKSSPREPAEVLRALPGVDTAYYGQGGIPSGPSVRGYTDRNFGQDLAGFIDGIPLNLFGFVASHGAMDITPVFTGSVERVELVRGPLDARYGDFHRGGSVNFVTRDGVPEPSVTLVGGSFGTVRGGLTYGNYKPGSRAASVYSNVEGYRTDGYANDQDNKYAKTFNKLYVPAGSGDVTLAFQGYWARWHAPSYIDRDLVRSGALDEKTAVNPTDGGNQNNQLAYLRYRHARDGRDPFSAIVYADHRDWTRWRSDFLLGPTQNQTQQIDHRWTYGFRAEQSLLRPLLGRPSIFLVGAALQHDDARTRQDQTKLRQELRPTDNIDELLTNFGVYAQEQWRATDWFKVLGGLRYSKLKYDIHDNILAPGKYVSSYDAGIVNPKAGVAFSLGSNLGLYANFSTGMRSPTPRNEVRNSITSVGRVQIAKTENYETGVTARISSKLDLLGVVWRADNSNEIRSIPPGTEVESLGRSRRYGVEGELNWYPRAWTRIYGGVSFLHVRLTTPTTPSANHLPDVPDYVHKLGFEFHTVRQGSWPGTLSVSTDLTFNGPKDLNTTGTIRSDRYQRVTASVAYTTRDRYRVWLGGFAYPGSRIGEAAFLFNQKVGVRANPRVSLEGGITYRF